MSTILNIRDLIEDIEDLEFTEDELNIINERLNLKSAVQKSGKASLSAIKSSLSLSFKGIRGVKSWIDYLTSIERYTILIRDTEERIKANTNKDRDFQLKSRLDKYRYKLKKVQLKEQNKKSNFIADTEVKIKKLEDLKQSDPNNSEIEDLDTDIQDRKRFLSKIGYSI